MEFKISKYDCFVAHGFKGRYEIGDVGGGKALVSTPCGQLHTVPWDEAKQFCIDWDVAE